LKQRRVRFTRTAHEHVRREKEWWLENRDHTEIFADELEQALRLLAVLPGGGHTLPLLNCRDDLMTAASRSARLRARLYRTRDDHPATRRDLAIELIRDCPRDASSWGSLASALIDLGLYTKARAVLRRLEKFARDGDHYLVCVRWGQYYKATGDLKRAESWYRKAAAEVPAALVFLGGVLAKQGRLPEAKRCHRRATRAREDDQLARDEAYFNLGLILRAERRYREALACFDRAIALDPKYAVAFKAQADVRSALEVIAPAEHSNHWRRMLAEWGPNPATGHELVRAYTRRYPSQSAPARGDSTPRP
jgi:tetratricopeptide (TPR) repeat protein